MSIYNTNSFYKQLPEQRVTLKEKLKNDKSWAKKTIDYVISYSYNDFTGSGLVNDFNRKLSNYRLFNNELDQEDFERECNPLGIEVGQFKDHIHPYNKTYNKIEVLLGEELKRNFDFKAVIVNSEGIKEKEVMKTELLRQYVEQLIEREKQIILKRVQEKNPQPDISNEDPENSQRIMQEYQNSLMSEVDKVLNPDEVESYMSTEYQEAREIMVQKIINYLMRDLDVRELMNDSFKHALISGDEYTWVDERNGEPYLEVINPLYFFYYKSPEIKYVQDGDYAGYQVRLSSSEILNRFEEALSEKDKKRIEDTTSGTKYGHDELLAKDMRYHNVSIEYEYNKKHTGEEGSYGYADGDDWEVTHVEWVSRSKVGFYTHKNEYGEDTVDLVSENFSTKNTTKTSVKDVNGNSNTIYVFEDGSTLEWKWIPEVWEGIRIGSDIYINVRKKKHQFRSIDNPYKVKLGYHGLTYNNMNATSISAMDRMKPYQYLYFIIMHKMKKLIARDRGQSFSVDLSMIDERLGLEKTLYYLEEMDLDLFNSLQNADKPGGSQRGKIKSSVSRSNMQHILSYVNLLQFIDNEIGEAVGVTKQREGQVGQYETATNAQQSIVQSNHITERYFHTHSKHWEKVMSSLVQVSQKCWQDKKFVKQFVLDDLSRQVLEVDGNQLNNADFGIYISNSVQDKELVDTLRNMALPILQNEGKLTDIIKIYKALSSSELEREFNKQEAIREKKLQQQQEAQRQLEQEKIKAAQEAQEREYAHEKELKEMDIAAGIREKEIDVFKFQQGLDANNNGVPDPLEIEKLKTERDYNNKKLEQEDRHHKDKIKVEKMKAQNKPSQNKSKK